MLFTNKVLFVVHLLEIIWPGCWIFPHWTVIFDGHQSCTACDSCLFFFQSNIFTGDTMLCTVTNNTHNRIVTASPLSGEVKFQGHLENGADSVSRSRKHWKCKCLFHPSLGCLCFVPIFSPIMFISLCVGVYTSAPFRMPAHTHVSFHVWLAVSSPSALLCVFRSLPSLN